MSRRTLINLIFFNAVFALMLFWAVNNIVTVDRVERPYTITGDFAQAAGVKANAEVTYLGVHYGRVTDVTRTPSGVSVTMKIDRQRDIPAGSIARIFRKSAIGEPYIDFVPPDSYTKGSDDRIEPGDNVPLSRTTVPLEFSELLRSASGLISSIDPEAAGGLIHELAAALDGRGDSLRTLTTSIDRLTASFVEKTDQLDRLAENSTRITSVLSDHRLSLGRSIENLRAVAESLRNADGDTRVLLDLGPDFLGTTADLVADQKRNLDCLLTDLAPVIRTLASSERLEDLALTLQQGPLGFGYAAATVDREADGPWVRVNLLVGAEGENADVYIPKRSLPVVPTVPACASPLTATAVVPTGATAATPTTASPRSAGSVLASPSSTGATGADVLADPAELADTGGNPLVALGLLLVAGALATRHARRRERAEPGPEVTP
jgi:phospholipid/cholesterol/gamma-HCH transport system substrate-binding protein